MPISRAALAALSQIASFATAVAGGLYFGLFSCGGPHWYWRVFEALAAVVLAATLSVWPPGRYRLVKSVGFVVVLVATFVIVQATIAPLPWVTPTSRAYWRQVLVSIQKGPC